MANKGAAVQFVTTTYAEYKASSNKNENAVYFCEDTKQIFVGSVEFTRKNEIESNTARIEDTYTKSEVDELELISVDDIDSIWGTTIEVASGENSEVRF